MKQVNIKTVCETVPNETIVEDEAYAEANAVSTRVHRPWFKHPLNMCYIFNIVHSSSEYAYMIYM